MKENNNIKNNCIQADVSRLAAKGAAVKLKVLVACEYSGTVRDAFALRGHDATSCDLLPGEIYMFKESGGKHYQGSVFDIINEGWDLMVGHPPCTYLSYAATGVWNTPGRAEKREEALEFFKALWVAPIEKICLENPLGYASTWRKYDQIINPWQFGEPFNKRTCLWLKNLPLLVPTEIVKPVAKYYANGKKKVCTDIMSNGSGDARRKARSKFWDGIANAMAEQWGGRLAVAPFAACG